MGVLDVEFPKPSCVGQVARRIRSNDVGKRCSEATPGRLSPNAWCTSLSVSDGSRINLS